ncbi:uncharacterized protein LOC142771992 [Rhipicephalus microplus]|uniref:uncharacterized protein LOC142771992 n=1 Tax=Rhipicephalus microplus TaxID=6941 RepID=UPI003F6D67F3
MVESLDMCSTLLHQLLDVFTAFLQMCWVDLEQKKRSGSSPQKNQAPSKLPKLSSTGTARSLCGIEKHCKECLISTLCCSFIVEDEVDHSKGTSRCVLCLRRPHMFCGSDLPNLQLCRSLKQHFTDLHKAFTR